MATSYTRYHQRLLETLAAAIPQQPPFSTEEKSDEAFISRLEALLKLSPGHPDYLHEGQQLICRIVAAYPHITPLIPRDLFWFFGGDCLHFMPDEEIQKYQALDERRIAAGDGEFNYEQERAKLFGLH